MWSVCYFEAMLHQTVISLMHYFTDLLNGESNETCKKNVYEKEACFWDFLFIYFTLKKNLIFITVM